MTTATAERLLTTNEVADQIGCNEQTVRQYARTGDLRSTKVGPHRRYRQAWVDEFLAANETPAPTPKASKPSRSPRYSN